MYFVECSIHLIEEYWLQLHISSGFRSNHLLLRQCCFVWSEIIRPHSSGNVRFSESMPVRLFGYLYSKNSDSNCESLAYNSSNTPLTFDSKGRSSISIIPHIILSVILILFNCWWKHRHTGNFLPGGRSEQFAQKVLACCPNFHQTIGKNWGSYDATT